MKKIIFFIFILSFAISMLAQNGDTTVVTRNNKYKIDDRLLPYVERANRERSSESCLLTCDTLYREAVKLGEAKAICMSYAARLQYWFYQEHQDSITALAEKLREVSRNNGYSEYFYFAYTEESAYFIKTGKFTEAKQIINLLYADAVKDNNPMGLYYCYTQNAHLYNYQGSYHKATQEYIKAAEYMKDNIPGQDVANAYLQACMASIWDNKLEDAIQYAQIGIDNGKDSEKIVSLYNYQSIAFFLLDRIDEFNNAYAAYEEAVKKNGKNSEHKLDPIIAAKYTIDGEYDKAIEALNKSILNGSNDHLYHPFMKIIYEKKGDYKNAMLHADSAMFNAKRYYEKTVEMNTSEMTALLDMGRLEAEKNEMKLKNELSRRRLWIYFLCSFILCGIGVAWWIMRAKRKNIEQLSRAYAVKDQFVKNITHEVRTPLNAIVGYSQLLVDSENLSPEERDEFNSAVAENGNALAMLIEDVLVANDLIEGKYKVNIAETSLMNVCQSAIRASQGRLTDGVGMLLLAGFDESLKVETDASLVQQILINLLNNACKNTHTGRIILKCDVYPDTIQISVSDTGCGIPEDKAERVFERFFKIDEFKQGVGLGLSISRDIAEHLGGTLKLDTSYKGGAKFDFELPLKKA